MAFVLRCQDKNITGQCLFVGVAIAICIAGNPFWRPTVLQVTAIKVSFCPGILGKSPKRTGLGAKEPDKEHLLSARLQTSLEGEKHTTQKTSREKRKLVGAAS